LKTAKSKLPAQSLAQQNEGYNMPAAPLLDIRVTHPYYADLRCGDFLIAPSEATAALMRRLRLTCKSFPDSVRLFAELDGEGGTFAAHAAPFSLDFALCPRSSHFASITRLSEINAEPAPLFTNDGIASADTVHLRLTSRKARTTETLMVWKPGLHEAFVLGGNPLHGATAADFVVAGAGAVMDLSSDLKRIAVDTSAIAQGATFQISYPVRAAKPQGALAEVALALDASLLVPATAPRAFVVPLAAAQECWVYYVVTNFSGDLSTLRIVDSTPGSGPRAIVFADSDRVELTATPDASDAVGQDLISRNPGRRVFRLLSNAPLEAREQPLGQLELRLADTPLLARLPNPRPDRLVLLRSGAGPPAVRPVRYQVLTLISS
jgi:hypothetical protein